MSTVKFKVKRQGMNSENYLFNMSTIFSKENLYKIADESLDDFIKASPDITIASGWSYNIKKEGKSFKLSFENSTFENGENIAIIIDVGHGTASGGWVPGKNYLKEPIRKTYERINKILREA